MAVADWKGLCMRHDTRSVGKTKRIACSILGVCVTCHDQLLIQSPRTPQQQKNRHVATHLCVLAGQQNHVVWVESSQISVVVQTLKSCLPFLGDSSCGTCMSCVRSPRRDGWVGQVGSNHRCQFLPSNAKDGIWPAVMRCCRFLRIESSK